jgi:hypothetical protein
MEVPIETSLLTGRHQRFKEFWAVEQKVQACNQRDEQQIPCSKIETGFSSLETALTLLHNGMEVIFTYD